MIGINCSWSSRIVCLPFHEAMNFMLSSEFHVYEDFSTASWVRMALRFLLTRFVSRKLILLMNSRISITEPSCRSCLMTGFVPHFYIICLEVTKPSSVSILNLDWFFGTKKNALRTSTNSDNWVFEIWGSEGVDYWLSFNVRVFSLRVISLKLYRGGIVFWSCYATE